MTLAEDTAGFTPRFIETNGIRLHAIEGGPSQGPLVVLLHGFPEMHLAWRHQLQPLAKAGFRVVAPDLRGYNLSDKPPAIADYAMDVVMEDVAGLIVSCGRERAHVVAHDWGGSSAWHLAHKRPERLDKLVILNSPHPRVFMRRLGGIEQLAASWYMLLFQLPLVPEKLMRAGSLERVLKYQPRIKGAYDDEDLAAYRRAWAEPRALESMLAWYRAMRYAVGPFAQRSAGVRLPFHKTVTAPTLVMWGMDDDALPPGNLEGLERYVEDLKVVRVPNCSHWIMHDAPGLLSRELLAFL